MKKTVSLVFFFCISGIWQFAISAEDQWQGVERIVAVGDIHGDYDNYIKVLRNADLVNRRGNWIAGNTHFVQLGDLPDRGPDTHKIIEHMQKLERQALEEGGRVHPLIGNHEAMNVYGDLRYVHAGEYTALRTRNSGRLRDQMYVFHLQQVQAVNLEFEADDNYRDRFDQLYPLGYAEHRQAWSLQGEFGSWVAPHNTVIKINRSLFVHGGIAPRMLELEISAINDQVRAELAGDLPEGEPGLSEAEDGPLWYRGLATNNELEEAAHVDALLQKYDVDRIVIGHTPGLGTIVPRFAGKVLAIDTGISEYYGAHLASLLFEDGKAYAVVEDEMVAIPTTAEDLLSYYKTIIEIDSNSAALQRQVESMEASQ